MESSTILISIIIPFFNTPIWQFDSCLKSLTNQTTRLNNIEVVICDDNSSKMAAKALNKTILKYSKLINIVKITNEKNLGISQARNNAVNNSKGEWLLILDSDDILKPNCLEEFQNNINEYHCFIYSDHSYVDYNGSRIIYTRRKEMYHQYVLKYYNQHIYNPLFSCVYISHSELYKRSAFLEVEGYKGRLCEKPTLWIEIFEKYGAERIKHIPKDLYWYRQNPKGIVARSGNKLISTHEKRYLGKIQNHNTEIISTKYMGRIAPQNVKYFGMINKNNELIQLPYIKNL